MNWYGERSEIGATDSTMYRDHFDASMWQETFCEDLMIAGNGGPAKNVGLQFCADGVNPYKRKSYSMWFGALSILNLPPAIRHTVATMHLCFIVPGPKKPVCPIKAQAVYIYPAQCVSLNAMAMLACSEISHLDG